MDGAMIARLRWRRRGAWLWPTFIATIVLDAVIGHALPPAGESQTLLGAALVGCFFNLAVVVLLSHPIGMGLRRWRPDMPRVVARDYGGTVAVLAVAVALLVAGLVHRSTVIAHNAAEQDAIVRAQAWIGDRAPAQFRRNVQLVSTVAIQPGSVYRTCVPNETRTRTYCVIVKTHLAFASSVTFDGYESNAVFSEGTQ